MTVLHELTLVADTDWIPGSHLHTEPATNTQRGQRLEKTLWRMEKTKREGNVCNTNPILKHSPFFSVVIFFRPEIFAKIGGLMVCSHWTTPRMIPRSTTIIMGSTVICRALHTAPRPCRWCHWLLLIISSVLLYLSFSVSLSVNIPLQRRVCYTIVPSDFDQWNNLNILIS